MRAWGFSVRAEVGRSHGFTSTRQVQDTAQQERLVEDSRAVGLQQVTLEPGTCQ